MLATAHIETLQESLFSCFMGPRVVRCGSKYSHPLSHLANIVDYELKL